MIHFRYAQLICLTYLGFAYGIVMPVIIPIVSISLYNMYVSQRFAFAFIYKKPAFEKGFNNDLNDMVMMILEQAPIVMIIFTYWQLGNRQMFYNEVALKDYQS